jgi:hypothetical protein
VELHREHGDGWPRDAGHLAGYRAFVPTLSPLNSQNQARGDSARRFHAAICCSSLSAPHSRMAKSPKGVVLTLAIAESIAERLFPYSE